MEQLNTQRDFSKWRLILSDKHLCELSEKVFDEHLDTYVQACIIEMISDISPIIETLLKTSDALRLGYTRYEILLMLSDKRSEYVQLGKNVRRNS